MATLLKGALLAITATLLVTTASSSMAVGKCTEIRVAVCDLGFKYNERKGEDYCSNLWTKKGYTIPQGTTGLWGDPQIFGWLLIKDHAKTRDYWCK